MENNTGKNLYDLLVTRDLEPELLDSSGKAVTDPNEAELFSFDWSAGGRNYGTVVILLGSENELEIYYGDNLGRSMESDDRGDWYDFLAQMKNFATRNLLTFELNNLNRLKYTMQGMAAIKEGLFESYYGRRNVSYSDQPKKTRLMIQHSRNLVEGEPRYRAIESLYVESADGERFRVPSRSLSHGRMLARHVAEGGNPYDVFGQHINEIINEINTLGRFIRASRDRGFQGPAEGMIESAIRHYSDLKAKAKRMIGQRGYREELEQFDPAVVTETEGLTDEIREMFVQQSLDQRIEEALPILARLVAPAVMGAISNRDDEMKEVNEFESWAESVTEGTWALPDTPEEQDRLRQLMSEPLSVGPDATNATEQLYDILGDDDLFDRLEALASQDPDADARALIQDRLADFGVTLDIDQPEDTEPDSKPEQDMGENLDTDGVMMTRPSNMSSESIVRDLHRLVELARR
jgi:hypothetical protein